MKSTKTNRKCIDCGRGFVPRGTDPSTVVRCPECAAKAKSDAVIQIRTCVICGTKFVGYPGSLYCKNCQYDQERERARKYRQEGAKRHRGDTDICERCGKPYTIQSGMQKFCPDCKKQAHREKQRETQKRHRARRAERKKELQAERIKTCAYCGRTFQSSKPDTLCSDQCRHDQTRYLQSKARYIEGKCSEATWTKWQKKREEARRKVQEELNDTK